MAAPHRTPAILPEIDRAAWFALPEATRKILRGQAPLLEEFAQRLA